MDDELFSFGNAYCRIWCRTTEHRSYKNIYGVYVCKVGNDCVMRAYRVMGALANGEHFAGFLVKSPRRKHSMTLVSAEHSYIDDQMPLRGHWVIVEAESDVAAIAHQDVADVRHEILNPHPTSFCGVYFIGNGNGAVKIGQTSNCLSQRLAQLQAGSPHRLYVCASISTDSPKTLEKQIQRSLSDRRMHGEWFAMTDEEAISVAEEHGGAEVFIGREKDRQRTPC